MHLFLFDASNNDAKCSFHTIQSHSSYRLRHRFIVVRFLLFKLIAYMCHTANNEPAFTWNRSKIARNSPFFFIFFLFVEAHRVGMRSLAPFIIVSIIFVFFSFFCYLVFLSLIINTHTHFYCQVSYHTNTIHLFIQLSFVIRKHEYRTERKKSNNFH